MRTDRITQLLRDVADEVIRPRFRALRADQVGEKNPGDLVTVVDREGERLITEHLRSAYPEAVILGEEDSSQSPDAEAAFVSAAHGFTIDPLDGTKNFVNGSPDHAVMVAEHRDGTLTRSWIWQPEYATSYVAERGLGVTRNGEPLTLARTAGERGFTSRRRWLGASVGVGAPLALTWLSCGIDYPQLIDGDADFVVYGMAKPWDHLPGALMIEELGGFISQLDGTPFGVGSPDTSGVLVARTPQLAARVLPGVAALAARNPS